MAIHKLKIFSCRGSRYVAEKIAANFGVDLGDSQVLEFSDGEFQPAFDESIRGCTVFIVQSTFPPADNLMELLLMIDAAHRASAHRVIAVMPYFGGRGRIARTVRGFRSEPNWLPICCAPPASTGS